MTRGGLMDDVEKSYQGLKETIQTLGELREATRKTRLGVDSIIDYNVNDALNTLLPMSDYVEIQIGDVSEDVRRNSVLNVRNYTKEMYYKDVENVLLDYDGNVDIGEMLHYFDLENLLIKNVDILSWYNVLPQCTIGTIRFENCELAKHYSVRTTSDNHETSLDFIFDETSVIGKIKCVNCSSEFVDLLLLGIDKVDENHRFGSIEIDIK